jgi:hypothetical protein
MSVKQCRVSHTPILNSFLALLGFLSALKAKQEGELKFKNTKAI